MSLKNEILALAFEKDINFMLKLYDYKRYLEVMEDRILDAMNQDLENFLYEEHEEFMRTTRSNTTFEYDRNDLFFEGDDDIF